jgi:hypothetical protein
MNPASCLTDTGVIFLAGSGKGMELTAILHPVLRLRISGAIPLLPLCSSIAATGKTLPFIVRNRLCYCMCLDLSSHVLIKASYEKLKYVSSPTRLFCKLPFSQQANKRYEVHELLPWTSLSWLRFSSCTSLYVLHPPL